MWQNKFASSNIKFSFERVLNIYFYSFHHQRIFCLLYCKNLAFNLCIYYLSSFILQFLKKKKTFFQHPLVCFSTSFIKMCCNRKICFLLFLFLNHKIFCYSTLAMFCLLWRCLIPINPYRILTKSTTALYIKRENGIIG